MVTAFGLPGATEMLMVFAILALAYAAVQAVRIDPATVIPRQFSINLLMQLCAVAAICFTSVAILGPAVGLSLGAVLLLYVLRNG